MYTTKIQQQCKIGCVPQYQSNTVYFKKTLLKCFSDLSITKILSFDFNVDIQFLTQQK